MEIKAINALSFNGTNNTKNVRNKQQKEFNNPNKVYQTSPEAAKAMRNLIYGLMILGAAGATSSCEDLEVSASASASSSASAIAIGNNCDHHDTITIIKTDTIHDTDTIINTEIKPIYIKDYPFHLGDSLIAQGMNINIPIDGPIPNGTGRDSVVYVGSKAHNRYDNKYYESMVDSIGTNRRELAIVSKIVDLYDSKNPKTTYMKSVVTDVPGKGIKITRYVADTPKKPGDNEQYLWNYAGYEIRTNGRDHKQNIRYIFDNQNNLLFRGNYEKGQEAGTFMYGSLIFDPETGAPVYDEDGNLEFAKYNFDQAVVYSDYAKRSDDYQHPGWKY